MKGERKEGGEERDEWAGLDAGLDARHGPSF
jgi:hypothetical protein